MLVSLGGCDPQVKGHVAANLHSRFGWTVWVGPDAYPRSLQNFPMQANGAEILRLACCLATERGIRVCAPVHDALLIESEDNDIESAVAECRKAMLEASQVVLDGFPLRTDAKVVRWPDRYMDPRSQRMWDTVWSVLGQLDLATGGDLTSPPLATYFAASGTPLLLSLMYLLFL